MLLVDLAVIAACALAVGGLARRLGQAVVLGEIVAGLMLGPSLLGLFPGDLPAALFPQDVRPALSAIAQLALMLFMFGVGFEVDLGRLRRARAIAARTTAAVIIVPVIAAVCLAPALLDGNTPRVAGVGLGHFMAFLAIVLTVTAFPVLARMLDEAPWGRGEVGTLALLVAAATDVVAWTALAIVTALVAANDGQSMWLFAIELAAFFVLLTKFLKPLLRVGLTSDWFGRAGPGTGALFLLVAVTLSSAATTALGLHPVFGAFAVGVIAPREAREAARLLTTAGVVLVPTYFISTGLNFDIRTLGAEGLVVLAVVLVVATASKVCSAMWVTRRAGMEAGDALALGLLLNTRGLTELVVLDVGLKAGIIDTRLFTILVLFALITTAATMPLVPLALAPRSRRVEIKPASASVTQFQRVPEFEPEDVAA